MTTFRAHKETDYIQFEVLEFIKDSNKDMKAEFEALEKKGFKGHLKAYNYICEKFGSSFFSCVRVFANGQLIHYHQLKI